MPPCLCLPCGLFISHFFACAQGVFCVGGLCAPKAACGASLSLSFYPDSVFISFWIRESSVAQFVPPPSTSLSSPGWAQTHTLWTSVRLPSRVTADQSITVPPSPRVDHLLDCGISLLGVYRTTVTSDDPVISTFMMTFTFLCSI